MINSFSTYNKENPLPIPSHEIDHFYRWAQHVKWWGCVFRMQLPEKQEENDEDTRGQPQFLVSSLEFREGVHDTCIMVYKNWIWCMGNDWLHSGLTTFLNLFLRILAAHPGLRWVFMLELWLTWEHSQLIQLYTEIKSPKTQHCTETGLTFLPYVLLQKIMDTLINLGWNLIICMIKQVSIIWNSPS